MNFGQNATPVWTRFWEAKTGSAAPVYYINWWLKLTSLYKLTLERACTMDQTRRAQAQREALRVLASIEKSKGSMLRVDAEELVSGFNALIMSLKKAEDRIDELARAPAEREPYVQETIFQLPEFVRGMAPYHIETGDDLRQLKEKLDLISRCRIRPPLPSIPARSLLRNPR